MMTINWMSVEPDEYVHYRTDSDGYEFEEHQLGVDEDFCAECASPVGYHLEEDEYGRERARWHEMFIPQGESALMPSRKICEDCLPE